MYKTIRNNQLSIIFISMTLLTELIIYKGAIRIQLYSKSKPNDAETKNNGKLHYVHSQ